MKIRHVIESQQFTVPALMELFALADNMERVLARGGTSDYRGRIMALLFYEHSTRTRFSFESAMLRLGGSILATESAHQFSSVMLGETLEDTVRVVSNYSDVIVIRSDEVGGAARAAAVASVPVINAGDGKGGQHPTQALLDLYTIHREIKTIDGVKIAMVGNLADGRTVRSLSYLLSKFERVKLYFIAPKQLRMRQDIIDYLHHHNVWYTEEEYLRKIINEVDVVYMTRLGPSEREGVEPKHFFMDESLMKLLPSKAIVMHPLPRASEISPEVDADPRSAYFRQTRNGILVRMALLASVLEG